MKMRTLREIVTKAIKRYAVDEDINKGFCHGCDALAPTFIPALVSEICTVIVCELDWIDFT